MRHGAGMAAVLCVVLCTPVQGQYSTEGGRWVTFKETATSAGPIAHQIDRKSIQDSWAYKTFWSRQWAVNARSPLTFTDAFWDRLDKGPIGFFTEEPVLWSQQYMVDCSGHRFGTRFVASNRPSDVSAVTPLRKMIWSSLDRFPAVLKTVCL
jgi:hypothetical protein